MKRSEALKKLFNHIRSTEFSKKYIIEYNDLILFHNSILSFIENEIEMIPPYSVKMDKPYNDIEMEAYEWDDE